MLDSLTCRITPHNMFPTVPQFIAYYYPASKRNTWFFTRSQEGDTSLHTFGISWRISHLD